MFHRSVVETTTEETSEATVVSRATMATIEAIRGGHQSHKYIHEIQTNEM